MRCALSMFVVLAGCSGDVFEARKLPADVAADAQAAVASNNAFACDLYQQLHTRSGNFFASPFSISTALSMLELGANGDTDAQLRAALHETLASDATGRAYGALLDSLDTGTSFDGYSLDLANRVFGQNGYAFSPSYISATRDDYGAPLQTVDFANAPGTATNTINTWVSQQTDGAIPALFGQGALDSDTRLVVANAIRFQGSWDVGFASTAPGPFDLGDGTKVSTSMMKKLMDPSTQLRGFADFTLAAMPFKGKDMTLIVLLPDAVDGLPALEAELTPGNLASWLSAARSMPSHGVDVTFPKLTVDSSFDLETLLQSLGVVDAFDPSAADFTGIAPSDHLYLHRVRHEAHVIVDENGAIATAATGVSGDTKISLPVTAAFTADHPFVFLIHDEVTGAVLFMGRIVDPR